MADPQIVYPQNPLTSKSWLVNTIGSALVGLAAKYGLGTVVSPDIANQLALPIALGIMGVGNLIVRQFTSGPIVWGAPKKQPAPQDLPAGKTSTVSLGPATDPAPASIITHAPGLVTMNVPPDHPPPAAVPRVDPVLPGAVIIPPSAAAPAVQAAAIAVPQLGDS